MNTMRFALTICLTVTLAGGTYQAVRAHEGHATLPSTGVTVDGNQLLLSAAAVQAVGMKTEMIKLGDLDHTLRVNAVAELPWSRQTVVSVFTSGRVRQVLVKPGQRVQAGQELARVESLELETLQAELLQTAAEIKLLERRIAQREKMVTGGSMAARELLETRARYEQKLAQRFIVHRQLQTLGLDEPTLASVMETGQPVLSMPVSSPVDGVIQRVDVWPGQVIELTRPLFTVVDPSILDLVGQVLEGDAFQATEGDPITVAFAGLPDREYAGEIEFIRMKLDESKRMLEVVVPLDNHDGRIQPGMFGRMAITVAAARQQILCPTAALWETQGPSYVLRREVEGRFVRQPVRVGMRTRNWVVIESGLFPGQQVVTGGVQVLAPLFHSEKIGSPLSAGSSQADGAMGRAAVQTVPDRIVAAKAVVQLPTEGKGFAMSLVEGRVVRLDVRPGQAVQTGDVLAEVESQELRNLQLDLLQSVSKLAWARDEAERFTRLTEKGAAAAEELWQRDLEQTMLTRQVATLERRLTLIGLPVPQIDRLHARDLDVETETPISGRIAIRSPLAGRVAELLVKPGEIVRRDDPLFEIQNNDAVWVEALFLERDASRVELGQEALVSFPANPSLHASGRVVRLAPTLTLGERVLPVWIEIANPSGFLKEGMLARVEITCSLTSLRSR